MQNDIGDCVVVELPNVSGQFQLPLADDSRQLEWQIAFVAKIGLEKPAIALPRTGDNRLHAAVVVTEPAVLGAAPSIAVIAHLRIFANGALEQGERAIDTRVWSRHARDAHGQGFHAAEIMPRTIHVKYFFG